MPATYYALGLVGYPLGHSFSPQLHTTALRECSLCGEYRLYPLASTPQGLKDLRELMEKVRNRELQGLNVTIPYKRTASILVDCLSSIAQGSGAVNTVLFREGELIGENTDVDGFWRDLARSFPTLTRSQEGCNTPTQPEPISCREALVLGAGGSARAVVYALCRASWKVVIAARRQEQVNELAADFSAYHHLIFGRELSWSALHEVITQHDIRLIVNTTPLGMPPYEDLSPWCEGLPFPRQAVLYDLVYNPAETLLIKQARLAGLEAVNGLGMLLEQAALSFELWTGIHPPVEAMRKAIQE